MSNDQATLAELNQGYVQAVEERDQQWFEEHLSQDFTNTHTDGSFENRAQFIERIGRDSGVSNRRLLEVAIRILGDFAVIHARTASNIAGGEEIYVRYTDLWARRGDQWQCLGAQLTRCA